MFWKFGSCCCFSKSIAFDVCPSLYRAPVPPCTINLIDSFGVVQLTQTTPLMNTNPYVTSTTLSGGVPPGTYTLQIVPSGAPYHVTTYSSGPVITVTGASSSGWPVPIILPLAAGYSCLSDGCCTAADQNIPVYPPYRVFTLPPTMTGNDGFGNFTMPLVSSGKYQTTIQRVASTGYATCPSGGTPTIGTNVTTDITIQFTCNQNGTWSMNVSGVSCFSGNCNQPYPAITGTPAGCILIGGGLATGPPSTCYPFAWNGTASFGAGMAKVYGASHSFSVRP